MRLPLYPESTRRGVAEYWIGVQKIRELLPDTKPEEFTCWDCPHQAKCDSAWDMYNFNGDCLESK